MSSLPNRDEKHLQELLAGKVLGDLSNDELQEFGELFSAIHSKDLQELELAAAALQLALTDSHVVADAASVRITSVSDTALPDYLKQKIADEAGRFVSLSARQTSLTITSTESRNAQSVSVGELQRPQQRLPYAWRELVAWLAVAASLLVAAQLWLSNTSTQSPTAAESRLALLNDSQQVLRVDWSAGKTPFANAVTGDVVWNNESQQGFMRFVGMPPNDPTKEQYQLWIIDPDRDAEPIDGGVFDIASTGEVVVPIQAKLRVLKPAAFAITIEQPGGVVVSTQERLPLLAQVSN
jgi:anti-sigma-K factor RskA